MSDLKTLKDLPRLKSVHPDASWGLVKRNDLRQEVIKWIKHIQNDIEQLRDLESKPQSPLQQMATRGLDEVLEGQIKVMSDFHNITDEELA